MKDFILILILALFALATLASEIKNIRSQFRKKRFIHHSVNIASYADLYLAPSYSTPHFVTGPAFDAINYQVHYKFLPTNYQVMVSNIVRHYSISSWPLVVRKLVLPHVYGYYSTDVLDGYLTTLHTHLSSSYPVILEPSFNVVANVSDKENDMNAIIEEISKLEEEKKKNDEELAELAEILDLGKKNA